MQLNGRGEAVSGRRGAPGERTGPTSQTGLTRKLRRLRGTQNLSRLRWRRGLTLLEVVVGLGILSMIAGAVYGIVMGSLEATASLSAVQSADRRVETFLDRTRTALAHLPAGATLELKIIEAEPLRQELTLRGVAGAYVWGSQGGWSTAVTLAPQRWPEERAAAERQRLTRAAGARRGAEVEDFGNRLSLAMTVADFYREDPDGEPAADSPLRSRQGHQLLLPDVQGRFWLDLLPEVQRVEWRFYDPAKKQWRDQSPPVRPPLVELLLTLPGQRFPLRVVFETA